MNANEAIEMIDRGQVEIAQLFAGSTAWQTPWEMIILVGFGSLVLLIAFFSHRRGNSVRSFFVGLSCGVAIVSIATGFGLGGRPFDRLSDRIDAAQAVRASFADAGGCDVVIPAMRAGVLVRLSVEQENFVRGACGDVEAAALQR